MLCNIRHNCRIKTYPDGSQIICAASAPIFREPGWEPSDKWGPEVPVELSEDELDRLEERRAIREESGVYDDRARRRARSNVRDLGLCNDFRWFVTLTLDKSMIDRYDAKAVVSKLNRWADNAVRRHGLKYVLVPELHKDGAIHFHGFFSDALPVVDSGTMTCREWMHPRKPRSEAQRRAWLTQGASIVYNFPSWKLGFTTGIELYGERAQAVAYVCKYISKQPVKVAGRWYYSGGALARPAVTFCDIDYSEFSTVEGGYTFIPEGFSASVTIMSSPSTSAVEKSVDKLSMT